MKFLAIFVLIASIGSKTFGQDDSCKNDFMNFLQCMKDSSSSDHQQMKQEMQDKANQCFQQFHCNQPNWTNTLSSHLGGQGPNAMPDSVKQCLKQKLMAKVSAKLNDCLSKRGVQNVNFTDFVNSMDGTGLSGEMGGGKEGVEGMISAKINVVKAVDKCCVDNYNQDPSKMKPLEQCLQNNKDAEKPKICAKITPCKAKASQQCQQRGTDIVKALCMCKKDKETEIAGKLRQLGQSQTQVQLSDLIKTVAGDQDIQDISNQIDQCYQDNNVPEPPLLKVALAAVSKGGLGSKFTISGRQCIIMADMLDTDAADTQECDNCPN